MSMLDDLLSGDDSGQGGGAPAPANADTGSAPTAPTGQAGVPAAPSQAVPATPAASDPNQTNNGQLPDRDTFADRYGWASAMQGLATHGIVGALAGYFHARATAPQAYEQALQEHQRTVGGDIGNQEAQLGLDQTKAYMGQFGGTGPGQAAPSASASVAPPLLTPSAAPGTPAPAGLPAPGGPAPAPGMLPPGAPGLSPQGGQPSAQGAPTPGAPPSGQPTDPMAARRALIMRMGQTMLRFPKFAQLGQQALSSLRQGLPEGTDIDPTTGNIVPMKIGDTDYYGYKAGTAQATAAGTASVDQPNKIAAMQTQAGLDRGTNAQKIALEEDANTRVNTAKEMQELANRDTTWVDDNNEERTGPYSASPAGQKFLANVAPSLAKGPVGGNDKGVASNAYTPAQIKDVTGAQDDLQSAGEAARAVSGLVTMAKGLPTGAWGKDVQSIRKNVEAGLQSLGIQAPELAHATSSGEVLNYLSQQIQMQAVHAVGTRPALGLIKMIGDVKAGMNTTPEGIDKIASVIQAAKQRAADYADYSSKFYANPANRTRVDAASEFAKSHPDEIYTSRIAPLQYGASVKPIPGARYTYKDRNGAPQVGVFDGMGFKH